MEGYNGKKAVGGVKLSRSSGLSFREANHEDKNSQCCNRIGCSTRHSSIGTIQTTIPDKLKSLKPPLRFKSSNPSPASSSRPLSSPNNLRKYHTERQHNQAPIREAFVTGSSNGRAGSLQMSNWESSSPNAASPSRYGKQVSRSFGSSVQDPGSSFLRQSTAPRCAPQSPITTSPAANGDRQSFGLGKLGCASISDVLPTGSSGRFITRGASVRRKLQDGEGSSNAVLSPPERQESSRQAKDLTGRDTAVSIRSGRSSFAMSNRRTRLREPEFESALQLNDPLLLSQPSRASSSRPDEIQESSQRSFSPEIQSVFHVSSSRSSQNRRISGSEDGDDYMRFNMEGIAEVLLALERIEQDDELTDELFVLEASLFLGGLSFHDQHRDMRLDIDNMSYEELLALEEEMGTVNTALSDEALSKCLKRSRFRMSLAFPGTCRQGNDVKCSICQEEYMIGDEVGSLLPCEHRYHDKCIRQWLRLKNWCPICKTAAASSKQESHP